MCDYSHTLAWACVYVFSDVLFREKERERGGRISGRHTRTHAHTASLSLSLSLSLSHTHTHTHTHTEVEGFQGGPFDFADDSTGNVERLQIVATNKYPATPNTMQRIATHCNNWKCETIAAIRREYEHCDTLQHTAIRCSTLQHTATHCNALQRTATHCSTLQHTAIQSNILQQMEI